MPKTGKPAEQPPAEGVGRVRRIDATADGVVKSADRTMALLELFRGQQRPLTAREIAASLAIPRSSTNVLLRSLIRGGYLSFDTSLMRYLPTFKIVALGSWLLEGHLDDAGVDAVMAELSRETGETITLSAKVGGHARFIRVVDSPLPIALKVKHDAELPLFTSAVGQAILSRYADTEVRAMLATSLPRGTGGGAAVSHYDILSSLARVRGKGTSVAYDRWLPDTGAVAVGIDYGPSSEPMAIAVGGPSFRIKRREATIAALLLKLTERLRRPEDKRH